MSRLPENRPLEIFQQIRSHSGPRMASKNQVTGTHVVIVPKAHVIVGQVKMRPGPEFDWAVICLDHANGTWCSSKVFGERNYLRSPESFCDGCKRFIEGEGLTLEF